MNCKFNCNHFTEKLFHEKVWTLPLLFHHEVSMNFSIPDTAEHAPAFIQSTRCLQWWTEISHM